MKAKWAQLLSFLKKKGGMASYAEIIRAGFDKANIRNEINHGLVQKIDRGLYRLASGDTFSHPDLVAAAIKIPKGVVCLLSALAFHQATNEIPRNVDMAIPRGAHANRVKYPPIRFYRFAPSAWDAGIELHNIEGHEVKIYCLARTIADCFKFRSKIGMDVARDALKVAIMEKGTRPQEIMQYAKICRVENIIKPVLEAML
jgi:predicted transcriptional regulator of viral defense system